MSRRTDDPKRRKAREGGEAMSAKVIPIEDWLEAFREVASEVSLSSFRFDRPEHHEGDELAVEPGAFIALLSDANAVHLGFSSTPDGCRTLARGFLGVRSDVPLSEADVVDGVGEVMNILAGKVKSKMAARDGAIRLGLPIFVRNAASVGRDDESVAAEAKLGPVACRLVVYQRKQAA